MGSKSGSPPTPPDPNQVAGAQTQANLTAAQQQQQLNAINQSNPWGSINYHTDPNGQISQTTQLNPWSQAQLNNQQQGGAWASQLGLGQLGGLFDVNGAYSHPADFSSANPLTSHVDSGRIQSSIGGYGAPQGSVANNAGQYQTSLAPTHNQISSVSAPGQVRGGSAFNWDLSNMPNLNQDYGAQAEHAYNLALGAQMPVLNQLQGRQQRALDARLAGQGFVDPHQAGYQNSQSDLAQNQSQAYNQLANQAYGAGLATQGQLFGEQLGSRQQLFGEQNAQAQNAMQAQQLTTQAGMANAQNSLAAQGLGLQAQGQEFGQNLAAGQFANQALGQQFGQNLAAGEYGLNAQNQAYNQSLGAGLYGLGAQGQQFGQGLQNAQLGNQTNQQQLQNMMLQRQYPLQEMGQLMGWGGGVQSPQFGGVPQAGVQAPNIGQYYYNNFGAQQDAYNQQQAGANNTQSGLFGLGSSVVGAMPWGSWFSHSSLKDVHGDAPSILDRLEQLPIKTWNYKGDAVTHIGPMAEDWAAAFGGNGISISAMDMMNVMLKAIQELSLKVRHGQ